MKVNGKTIMIEKPLSLAAFLREQGYTLARIVIERNGEIVPKKDYEQVMLTEGDTLEIITFMGGG